MVIQIEISKGLVSDRWRIRTGDIEGSTEISGTSKKDLLKEIKMIIDEEDDGHDVMCEGSMCWCKARLKKEIEYRKVRGK